MLRVQNNQNGIHLFNKLFIKKYLIIIKIIYGTAYQNHQKNILQLTV